MCPYIPRHDTRAVLFLRFSVVLLSSEHYAPIPTSTVGLMEAVSLFRASRAASHKARILSHKYEVSCRHLNF